MIVKKQENNYKTVNFEGSKKMNIDQDSLDILLPALSENLYSNPIGSIVREWTSNAIDATIEAKSDSKVKVGIEKLNNNFIFFVEDFGTGISEEKVDKIISKFGASTKRETNEQFGFFGLGLKSGLSYRTSFYILTRFEGVEYTYVIYKTEGGSNVDLVSKVETSSPNGTKIFIDVKPSDISVFENEINEQLLYLENIEFVSYNSYSEILKLNHSVVYESKTFKYSNSVNLYKMHICYNDICYRIDFEKLGISTYGLPIGIKISHEDGIFPTPNRESFVYTENTKKIIKEKIINAAKEIFKMIDDKKQKVKTIIDIINFEYEYITFGNDKLYVKAFIDDFCKKKFSEFPNILNLKHPNYEYFYSILNCQKKNGFSEIGEIKHDKILMYKDENTKNIKLDKSIILTKNNATVVKKYIYIYYQGYKIIRILPFKKVFSLFKCNSKNCLFDILDLKNYSKKEWRNIIIDFKKIYDSIEENILKDTDIVVPKEFINEYKKNKTIKRLTNIDEISVKECYFSYSFYKAVCSQREVYPLTNKKTIGNYKTIVYSSDESMIKSFVSKLRLHKNINFVVVGKTDEKKLNLINSKNLIHMDNLEQMDIFKRIAMRVYLAKFITKNHKSIKEKLQDYMSIVNCISSNQNTIDCKYINLYRRYRDEISKMGNDTFNENDIQEIIEFVENNSYFKPLLEELKEFDRIANEFSFLTLFAKPAYYEKEKYKEIIDCIIRICKSKGIRLNYSFYKYINPESIETQIEQEITNA